MFLRNTRRWKDGKEHRYWSIVENRRCAEGKVVQRPVLYLGEINDSQRESWCRVLEGFDEDCGASRQMALFAWDRPIPAHAADCGIGVRLKDFELHLPRQWGACWLACELYKQVGLDDFWRQRLPDSREGTRWRHILQTLVCYRLIEPGSEPSSEIACTKCSPKGTRGGAWQWKLHRQWFSAMGDLLGAWKRTPSTAPTTACWCTRANSSNHKREDRIESHMLMLRAPRCAPFGLPSAVCLAASAAARLISFLAYCLHVTLRARLRPHAPGLTPRAVLDKFAAMQMLDVHFPTTDGRTLILSRYTQPEADQKILLEKLRLQLPDQPPPRITSRGPIAS